MGLRLFEDKKIKTTNNYQSHAVETPIKNKKV